MVNIYIYVDSRKYARDIAVKLMEKELLAHASIGKDNGSFIRKGALVPEEENYVITAQAKALLFDEVVRCFQAWQGTQLKYFPFQSHSAIDHSGKGSGKTQKCL